jgi:Putative member of DMT superfamily (DUF486)
VSSQRARSGFSNANNLIAHYLQHLHDLCVVGPPEIPDRGALESNNGQLGICVLRILLLGAANRIGSYEFNGAHLKTIQEVITFSVFSVFSVLYLGEKFKGN